MGLFGLDHPLGEIYSLLKDIFVVLVIVGTLVFVYYRVIKRLPRMTLSTEGIVILGIILVMMVADVLYDGASMVLAERAASDTAHAATTMRFHPWEPVGSVVHYALAGFSTTSVHVLQHVGFWTHASFVLLFLNLLPYSKHFHVITGLPNVYTQSLHPPGRLPPIEDIEGKLEREEALGRRRSNRFGWKASLDFYTCTEC